MIRHNLRLFSVLVFSVLCLYGCENDNAETLYPHPSDCDTTGTSFTDTIEPILNTHCLSCHSNNWAAGGYSYEGYNNVKESADDGSLIGSITSTNNYQPMPIDYELDQCSVDLIEQWIEDGGQNN